ncbi:Lysosome-associated membrane glycoprotein 1 [Collichthys lucidus]|uniref:Lysosome-associated membrane glycoprotein 1 n=1 Tax=Collichthys lucidus TaxID=240159 RepID=A0A4U5VWT7_COLLU|nr:Lysosome-associated membrane glycoprotein 1 [Collichthys lucidus]
MKRAAVLCAVTLCALSALSWAKDEPSVTVIPGEEFSIDPKPTPTPTTKPTAKPTAKPTTKPTAKPTTKPTAKPTTKPTAKPTTASTTTSTTKPTTTSTTKSTTKPTTTTPKTTTPSPKPTPPANVTVGSYNVTIDKKVCLLAQMGLQIRLETLKDNGTFVVQPKLTTASGECKETTAKLTLTFKEGQITFLFNKSVADNEAFVDTLSFNLDYPFGEGGNKEYSANNKSVHLFPAKIGHAYSCKNESLYMGNGLYLDVTQDRVQGFNLTKSNDFGTSDFCAADRPDYRVAIAVGVTLLVLILVVVVAYLLSRRRRTDGYQSL